MLDYRPSFGRVLLVDLVRNLIVCTVVFAAIAAIIQPDAAWLLPWMFLGVAVGTTIGSFLTLGRETVVLDGQALTGPTAFGTRRGIPRQDIASIERGWLDRTLGRVRVVSRSAGSSVVLSSARLGAASVDSILEELGLQPST